MVAATLDGMAAGGMYDLVGGGFHRYSVDDRWLVPHFEKMLYDNAVLASVYLHAWVVTGTPRYRQVVEETVEYVLRELSLDGGGLASAQDADTDGVEGLTHTWTLEEADEAGLPRELLEPFEHGRFVVRGELDAGAAQRGCWTCARRGRSRSATTRRSPPGTASCSRRSRRRDTGSSATTGWTRRVSSGSSCSGRCRTPTVAFSARCATAARAGPASSTTTRTSRTGCSSSTSPRASFAGSSRPAGWGCWRSSSSETTCTAASSSRPPTATSASPARRISRTRPIPSGNAMLAWVLLRLARLWGDDDLERRAVSVFRLVEPALRRAPGAFAWALCGLDLWFSQPREIAVVGPVESPVARAALAPFQPRAVVAVGPSDDVPLLAGKDLVDGKPAVYVCERFACQAPVTDPSELDVLTGSAR